MKMKIWMIMNCSDEDLGDKDDVDDNEILTIMIFFLLLFTFCLAFALHRYKALGNSGCGLKYSDMISIKCLLDSHNTQFRLRLLHFKSLFKLLVPPQGSQVRIPLS